MYSIYLICAITDNIRQWKVGLSKHPDKRIKELQTGNPNITGISCLYKISDRERAYKTEALLKAYLKPFKLRGEWIEDIALNETLFFEYCEKYEIIAKSLIEIKNNKIKV